MTDSVIALFCCLDDVAKLVEEWERHHLLPSARQPIRGGKLCLGEMLFIMVLFHSSAYKDFKHVRLDGIRQEYRDCFGELPNCSWFVSLMPRLLLPCCLLLHDFRNAFHSAQSQRQHRLGSLQCLDLCLLIYTEHDGVIRWFQIDIVL